MSKDARLGTMIDFWIVDATYERPEMITESIRDIHAHGWDTVHLFNVGTFVEDGDAEHVEIIKKGVEEAHRLGMKAMVSLNELRSSREFLRRHPSQCSRIAMKNSCRIEKGSPFEIRSRYFGSFSGFDRVERIFLLKKDKEGFVTSVEDLTGDTRIAVEMDTTIIYDSNAFTDRIKEVVLGGKLDGEGELVSFIRFRERTPDLTSPDFSRYIEEVLSRFKGIPIDGVSWDEASINMSIAHHWNGFYASEAFQESFRKECGYDLSDKLYLLSERARDGSEARLRCDYFRHMRDCLGRVQGHLKETAKRLFGENTASGIHHTWSETDSIDLRAGDVDYFYLRKVLTGGFVDNVFFFGEDVTTYLSALASSLSKGTDTGEAVSNAWCYRPTDESLEYHTRILALYNVRWFHIGYGDSSVINYPHHRTWDTCTGLARRNHEVGELLEGFERRSPNMLLQSWEGMAFEHTSFIHYQRIGSIRLVYRSALAHRPFEMAGPEDLIASKLKGDTIIRGEDRYRWLVLPWISVVDEKLWKLVEDFARAGGKALIYGAPPSLTPRGSDMGKRFNALLGTGAVSRLADGRIRCEEESLQAVAGALGIEGEITPDEDRSAKMWIRMRERTFKSSVILPRHSIEAGAAEPVLRHGDTVIGVKARDLDVWYFSFDVPMYEKVLNALLQKCAFPIEANIPQGVFAESYTRGDEWALALARRKKTGKLGGRMEFKGTSFDVNESGLALVKGKEGKSAVEIKTW